MVPQLWGQDFMKGDSIFLLFVKKKKLKNLKKIQKCSNYLSCGELFSKTG